MKAPKMGKSENYEKNTLMAKKSIKVWGVNEVGGWGACCI
jgi:hypothetical protein